MTNGITDGMNDDIEDDMKVVAIEEHMLPRDIIEAAGIDLGSRAGARAAALDDVGEGRLSVMDDAGIDVQVLSSLSYFVQGLEPAKAVEVNRAAE